MHRTALQYLDDILESIGNIEEVTDGISCEDFLKGSAARGCGNQEFSGYWRSHKETPG